MPEPEAYDPHRLITDVMELLEARGLHPERVDIDRPAARVTGACLLLRGLGIQPTRAPEDAFDPFSSRNYDTRVHND